MCAIGNTCTQHTHTCIQQRYAIWGPLTAKEDGGDGDGDGSDDGGGDGAGSAFVHRTGTGDGDGEHTQVIASARVRIHSPIAKLQSSSLPHGKDSLRNYAVEEEAVPQMSSLETKLPTGKIKTSVEMEMEMEMEIKKSKTSKDGQSGGEVDHTIVQWHTKYVRLWYCIVGARVNTKTERRTPKPLRNYNNGTHHGKDTSRVEKTSSFEFSFSFSLSRDS